MRHFLALTTTVAALIASPVAAQHGSAKDRGAHEELKRAIPRLMQLAEVPGLSIATF